VSCAETAEPIDLLLGCGLGWAEGSTSSIVFARWRQCTRRHSAVCCAKMAELIDLPFGLWNQVGRRKHKFNRIRQVALMCPQERAHWCHLANTTEPSVCGDTVLCQITLTTCYYWECSEPSHWVCKLAYLVLVSSQDKLGGLRQQGIRRKNGGMTEVGHWLVWMEWRPARLLVCLPLLSSFAP